VTYPRLILKIEIMPGTDKTIRISSEKMNLEFIRILRDAGFSIQSAEECAGIFTLNSLEGVYSHGVNRFLRFAKNIREGYIIPKAVPSLVHRAGSIEQWTGNLGAGPLNATFATERAIDLAKENGIGLVALANTNHWMRGGTYGWQAARKGFVFIGWTNTCPNMPAWGAKDPRLGNNPFVIGVPYQNDAIVLDFAMSQYSYGKIETYESDGRTLPFPGGFNKLGKLTNIPAEILETWRVLPAGYWKGASFSLLLDILATILSAGLSTHQINTCVSEYNVSQVFIAINIKSLPNYPSIDSSINQIIEDLHNSIPENDTTQIRYPGENINQIRTKNLRDGIPVNREIWEKILNL
jgi:3-dehydro-L-gulonate 2-dehydrogenase